MATPSPYVAAEALVKCYGGASLTGRRAPVRAVDGVTLTIGEGEAFGLVGETGSGKSTVARLLVGMTRADSGTIRIGGQPIEGLAGPALMAMRRRVQLVFQDPFGALDPRMRIVRSLEAPLAAHGIGTPATRRSMILEKLIEVGLDGSLCDRLPAECSGGQLQRVVIARALLLEPRFLICDEPTSALDASVRGQILNLLSDLRRRLGLTLLLISHDLKVVRSMCDRIGVMYLGEIVEIAPREDLFERPRHPYTQALIRAAMIVSREDLDERHLLRGEPPSVLSLPSGCRFHTRCPHAVARCSSEVPQLLERGGGGSVRCLRWREIEQGHEDA